MVGFPGRRLSDKTDMSEWPATDASHATRPQRSVVFSPAPPSPLHSSHWLGLKNMEASAEERNKVLSVPPLPVPMSIENEYNNSF